MTPVYHITHIRNLRSIVAAGGLFCDNDRAAHDVRCIGIAHQHIKLRRAARVVPTCRGGTLADYVPFYFAPRSPMLYAIHRGQVEAYQDGQRPVLHLVSTAERVAEANTAFTFTDGHAEIAYSAFYEDLADLASKINWTVMRSQYWNDDPPRIVDRKRKRQAEFLVPRFFPWHLFSTIGVINDVVRTEVIQVLAGADHQPEVRVQRNWYY